MGRLKTDVLNLWRPNFERLTINQEFTPLFTSYIGDFQLGAEYNDILKTIQVKSSENPSNTIVFDGSVPFTITPELTLIQGAVKDELKGVSVDRIGDLSDPLIRLFPDDNLNNRFLTALKHLVQKAVDHENFINESVRNNFVAKLVTYAYLYIKDLTYDDQVTCKCIYYGDVTKHDFYFLTFLHFFAFDVLFINPNKSSGFDFDQTELLQAGSLLPVESLSAKASKGQEIRQINSVLTSFDSQIEASLFSEDSGNYRPWQFKKGSTKPILFNGILTDLTNNWPEQAKFRNGFIVNNSVVTLPNFFFELEGIYNDFNKYVELYETFKNTKNVSILQGFGQNLPSIQDALPLTFVLNPDGSIDKPKLKSHGLYHYAKYNDDTERFMIEKMSEVITDTSLFVNNSKELRLQRLLYLLQLDESIIKLIDMFDFPHDIPKIIFYCGPDQSVDETSATLLAFLNKVGFDILLLSPGCQTNLSTFINPSRFSSTRLETVDYNIKLTDLKKRNKLLSKIFG